jgi:hypothetical protein
MVGALKMGVKLVLVRHVEDRRLSVVTTGYGLGIALGPLIASVPATFVFWLSFVIGGTLTRVGA